MPKIVSRPTESPGDGVLRASGEETPASSEDEHESCCKPIDDYFQTLNLFFGGKLKYSNFGTVPCSTCMAR